MTAVATAPRLSRPEVSRLSELEATIAEGLNTFVEVGSALAAIRDSRLYRGEFGTFEDYCRERWGMSRRQANRLVGSAEVVGNLGPIGPTSESQARPLTRLEPTEQREAWTRANEMATARLRGARHAGVTY